MIPAPVRPSRGLITEFETREIVSQVILPLCQDFGPTEMGRKLGVNEKTVRDARDEKSTLSLDTFVNLLALDNSALDGFLAHFGLKSVPIDCCVDGHSYARLQEARAAIDDVISTVRPRAVAA